MISSRRWLISASLLVAGKSHLCCSLRKLFSTIVIRRFIRYRAMLASRRTRELAPISPPIRMGRLDSEMQASRGSDPRLASAVSAFANFCVWLTIFSDSSDTCIFSASPTAFQTAICACPFPFWGARGTTIGKRTMLTMSFWTAYSTSSTVV